MIRQFLPGQLLQDAGKPGTVGEVIARLRCRRCREPPHTVTMFNHHHGTAQGPVVEVVLVGREEDRWR